MTTKAVILAGGLGTRMRRAGPSAQLSDEQKKVAHTGVKALIPIGRPFLDYVLTQVADAGYQRVCLVVAPDHDALRDYYTHLSGGRLEIGFAVQPQPLGTAHALATAADFVGNDPFLAINSDNFYPASALSALRSANGAALIGFERRALLEAGNITADRVARFSVIRCDTDGYLKDILEKPAPEVVDRMPEPVLISMNCWLFSPEIMAACRAIDRSSRREYEIPDAVLYSIRSLGQRYRVIRSAVGVLDLSDQEDIASVTTSLRGREVRL